MRALLDVNVLIALLDAEHVHHEAARRWLRENIRHGWATCPITENGYLRIMAQPGNSNCLPVSAVAERLREATAKCTGARPRRAAASRWRTPVPAGAGR